MIPNTTTRRPKAKNILVFSYKLGNKMVLSSVFFCETKDRLLPIKKNVRRFTLFVLKKPKWNGGSNYCDTVSSYILKQKPNQQKSNLIT